MAFYITSTLIIISALMVILSRNPIISAVWLVVCLFLQSVIFILLDAYLIAVLQVLLYAGAIMVLILFAIMLLDLSPSKMKWRAILGDRIIIGTGVIYLALIMGYAIYGARKIFGQEDAPQTIISSVESLGRVLLSTYAVPFELLSVLLLVAIVGSVVATRRAE